MPTKGTATSCSPQTACSFGRRLQDDALFDHYRHALEELGKQPGTLALIFGKAQNKFQEAKRRRVLGGHRAAARQPRALQRVEPHIGTAACQIFPNWA
jgi:hypothetical protein